MVRVRLPVRLLCVAFLAAVMGGAWGCDDDGNGVPNDLDMPSATDTASDADSAEPDATGVDTAADVLDDAESDADADDTATDADADPGDAALDAELTDAPELTDGSDLLDGTDAPDGVDDGGDAEVTDTVDADTGACGADCTTAVADFGGGEAPFDRAFYGLTSPAQSGSGEWEVYLEAQSGGSQACPDEQSPTPERSLILSGLVVPWPSTAITTGLSSTVLDFEGTLLTDGAVFTSATAVEVTVIDGEVCTSCVGMAAPSDPDGFVSLEIVATFPEGTVTGYIYAQHCDSFDLP